MKRQKNLKQGKERTFCRVRGKKKIGEEENGDDIVTKETKRSEKKRKETYSVGVFAQIHSISIGISEGKLDFGGERRIERESKEFAAIDEESLLSRNHILVLNERREKETKNAKVTDEREFGEGKGGN
jgi:hypothetical protein